MSCGNNQDQDIDNNVLGAIDNQDLLGNTGKIITCFTASGGCSGNGFTGLLVEVNCNFIKLITALPSAPRHPFGTNNLSGNQFNGNNSQCDRSRFGTAIVIPINQIVAYVFNEV